MVYVAYITSGRDKYDYYTDLIGVFYKREDAEYALKKYLIESRKIFDSYFDAINDAKEENNFNLEIEYFTPLKKFNQFEERLQKCMNDDDFIDEFKEDLLNIEGLLEDIISRYNDSYYQDGWDYTIDEVEIK